MKTIQTIFLLSVATASAVDTAQQTPSAYSIIERGQSYNIWEKTALEIGQAGQSVPVKHRYTELASGLNYKDANGSWISSQEQIVPQLTGGAAATQGPHTVSFPYDLYTGAIEQVTPEGLHLRSRPLLIAYASGTNSQLIAELTNSIGQITPAGNAVIYTNCTTDFACDYVVHYRKSGIECDLTVRQKPPLPDMLGFDPDQTEVQLWTEFFDTPEPTQQPGPATSDGMQDSTLQFGGTVMGRGSAFSVGNGRQPVPPWKAARVYKSWVHIEGRTFLVERVKYSKIKSDLDQLAALDKPPRWFAKAHPGSADIPVGVLREPAAPKSTRNVAKTQQRRPTANKSAALPPSTINSQLSTSLRLPPARPIRPSAIPMQLASLDSPVRPGLLWDYTTINSAATNCIFAGDTTYFISGYTDLYGTTVIEGGAILKLTNGLAWWCQLNLRGPLECKTAPYRPAVWTSWCDDSVGESISGSTGVPSMVDSAIGLDAAVAAPSGQWILHDVRMSYLLAGFISEQESDALISDCQFVNCPNPCLALIGGLGLQNVLATGADTFAYAYSWISAENVTLVGFTNFSWCPDSLTSLGVTNCIVVGAGGWGNSDMGHAATPVLDHTLLQTDAAGLFQTVGAASYYLSNLSTNRACGSTNLSPALLTDLRNKTTYPPIVYSNVTISAATTFSPQAQRETGPPDLGFAYDPLDYCFGGVKALANPTFDSGTATAWFELPGSGGPGYGIGLTNSVTNAFNGSATAPCIFARYYAVQEGGTGLWTDKGWLAGIASINGDTNQPPQVTANFTRMAQLANSPNHFRDYSHPIIVYANNSEFWSGQDGGYGVQFYLTNCLIDRCPIGLSSSGPAAMTLRNCTMHGASLSSDRSGGSWPVWIENSAFDSTTFDDMDDPSGGNTNITYCDFNAFLTNSSRLPIHGAHDVLVTNFNWQTSWLGSWYLQTNSPLINTGSLTADLMGLYHFVTQTNQVKETNSIVDIGYHYVAVDTNGIPLDFDGDSIADYLEDANGNGNGSDDTTSWLIYNSPNALTAGSGLQVYKPLK